MNDAVSVKARYDEWLRVAHLAASSTPSAPILRSPLPVSLLGQPQICVGYWARFHIRHIHIEIFCGQI
jgi:hypothetical protein